MSFFKAQAEVFDSLCSVNSRVVIENRVATSLSYLPHAIGMLE